MGNFHTIHGSQDATVEAHLSWGKTSSKVFLYWIKIKKRISWLKSVHLRTSSPPTMGSVKEVIKSYLHMVFFFFTLAVLLFERGFGEPPVGVHISFLLTTKYVKRSLLTKSLTRIFDFQLAALALKNNYCVIHYVIQISRVNLKELIL